MVKRKKIWLLVAAVIALPSYLAYAVWRQGSPYGEKVYSPNKAFYYQQYKVVGIAESLPRFSAPEHHYNPLYDIRGYVRAYAADGTFVGQSSVSGVPLAQLFWSRDLLVIMDGRTSEDREGIIILPDNSELPR